MDKQRTLLQNKCLHKLFGDVANELLAQGVERRTIINDLEGYTCPIDPTFMKEVWRMIQFTQTGKMSTTELTTSEIQRVYETFHRFLAESYAVHLPWPSMESMTLAYYDTIN